MNKFNIRHFFTSISRMLKMLNENAKACSNFILCD